MARVRSMTTPKMQSHRTGCTALVKSSIGSRRILRVSAQTMTKVCRTKSRSAKAPWRTSPGSTEASSGTSCLCGVTIAPSGFNGAAGKVHKGVVEGGNLSGFDLELSG